MSCGWHSYGRRVRGTSNRDLVSTSSSISRSMLAPCCSKLRGVCRSAFVTSRFRNPAETISPLEEPLVNENLLPAEAFLLSRLDTPMTLRDLSAISGLGEDETLQLVYSLALAGLIKRENWKPAFRGQQPTPPPARKQVKPATPPVREPEPRKKLIRKNSRIFWRE